MLHQCKSFDFRVEENLLPLQVCGVWGSSWDLQHLFQMAHEKVFDRETLYINCEVVHSFMWKVYS